MMEVLIMTDVLAVQIKGVVLRNRDVRHQKVKAK